MTGKRRSASEFAVVIQGPVAAIRLAPLALDAYQDVLDGKDELSVKRKVHLGRSFREYCDQRPHRLPAEKFRKEDSLPDGRGGRVAVWAFKARKWRLYGTPLIVAGRQCFVGVRVDAAKKQDRANQTLLRLAAKDLGELAEYRP